MIKHKEHCLSRYFLFILSNCRINFMISGRNWFINLPSIIDSFCLLLSHHQWVSILQK